MDKLDEKIDDLEHHLKMLKEEFKELNKKKHEVEVNSIKLIKKNVEFEEVLIKKETQIKDQ